MPAPHSKQIRSPEELPNRPGPEILAAINTIEATGGRCTHDSGHGRQPGEDGRYANPTFIYTFDRHDGAQIALPMNTHKLSAYVRAEPRGDHGFAAALSDLADTSSTYAAGGKTPHSALNSNESAPYLNPAHHRLLLLAVKPGKFAQLLDAYLGIAPPAADAGVIEAAEHDEVPPSHSRAAMTPEELQRQLSRNTDTGRAGERLVYAAELQRLSELGCPDPAAHVHIVADSDVTLGYDICSEWNGERRCIEVKATASGAPAFYLTDNEHRQLQRLGSEAWLYRVALGKDGDGQIVWQLQDPIANLAPACFTPAVWQVTPQL